MSPRFIRSFIGVAAAALGQAALAEDLVLTQGEFSTWPEYCQARYVTVPPGIYTEWAPGYPRPKIEAARRLLGPETFERVHHYCYGLIWLARSKLEAEPRRRDFALQQAQDEVLFTYRGLPSTSPISAPTFVVLGQICIERKQEDCALENLRRAISVDPTNPLPYSALAVYYRNEKKLTAARDILLEGNKAVGGNSPEIHYNLGLILTELGDYDGALQHAHQAYGLGYPLPGLRNRLQRLGKWSPPQRAPAASGAEP